MKVNYKRVSRFTLLDPKSSHCLTYCLSPAGNVLSAVGPHGADSRLGSYHHYNTRLTYLESDAAAALLRIPQQQHQHVHHLMSPPSSSSTSASSSSYGPALPPSSVMSPSSLSTSTPSGPLLPLSLAPYMSYLNGLPHLDHHHLLLQQYALAAAAAVSSSSFRSPMLPSAAVSPSFCSLPSLRNTDKDMSESRLSPVDSSP